MNRDEYVISAILCLAGVLIFFCSDTIPTMVAVEKSSVVNSRFFPKLMSLLMVCLSLIMAAENYLKNRRLEISPAGERSEKKESIAWIQLGAVIFICLLYFFLYEPLGFLSASILFMAGFLLIAGGRQWVSIICLSILVPLGVYLIFKTLLGVPLPEGIFYL